MPNGNLSAHLFSLVVLSSCRSRLPVLHIIPPPSLPSLQDSEVRRSFKRTLEKQGFKFKLGTKVNSAEVTDSGVKLALEPAKGGEVEEMEVDVVLVSTGGSQGVQGGTLGCTCVRSHCSSRPPSAMRLGCFVRVRLCSGDTP